MGLDNEAFRPLRSPRLRESILLLLSLLFIFLTFHRALNGVFINDDIRLIETNLYIRDSSYLKHNLTHDFGNVSLSDAARDAKQPNFYYRPLITLSYMLDYQLHGLEPWGYHLTNIILHLLNVLLVYLLTIKLRSVWRAVPLLVALLFAIHPTRAESVSWISGRTDLLMGMFALFSILLFWRALCSTSHRISALLVAWIAFLAALASKETAVALCLVIPILDWLLVCRGDARRFWRNSRWCHLPLVLFTSAFVILRLMLQPPPQHFALSLLERANLVLQSLGYYTQLIVSPFPPSMHVGVLYHPSVLAWRPLILGSTTLIFWGLLLWFAIRRAPRVAFALLLAGAFTLPVSNIVPLSLHALVAERFLYLPFLGVALLAGLGADRLVARYAARGQILVLVTLGLVTAMWALTIDQRNQDFFSALAFWRAEVAASPHYPAAKTQLAEELIRSRRYDEADALLRQSLQDWNDSSAHPKYAVETLVRIIDLQMLRPTAREEDFLQDMSRFIRRLLELADAPPRKASIATIKIDHQRIYFRVNNLMIKNELQNNRVSLLVTLGSIQSILGQDRLAVKNLRVAHELSPKDVGVMMNLSLVLARALEIDDALEVNQRAQRRRPGLAPLVAIGETLQQSVGRIRRLKRMQADPVLHAGATFQREMAELMIITNASLRACRHLRQLIRLRPDDRDARAMLALELASIGQQDAAQAVIEQAQRELPSAAGLERLKQQVRAMKEVQGKPSQPAKIFPRFRPASP